MRKDSAVSKLALATPLVLALGCVGEAVDENDILALEDVQATQQALGSTKPRVDISTWAGLTGMVSDGNYRLTANINASGQTWTPKYFSGTFDGNGKTISNLTINVSGDAAFFSTLNQAIVKNVKFTNLNVTGTWFAAGLATSMNDSQVEQIAIEGTIGGWFSAGGIFSHMSGGSLTRSYAKGTVQSANYYAGGLAAVMSEGTLGRATIVQSYAQVTVNPDTSDPARTVIAGGIVGRASGVDIHDVYAVGNVTGRNYVGGLVGQLTCPSSSIWLLYKGIYRGDVVDKAKSGWAGTVGAWSDCTARFTHLSWDSSLDPSTNYLSDTVSLLAQRPGTTSQHRSPTTPYGGFFCLQPGNCPNDNNFNTDMWDAGTSSQHHILKDMPGPNAQLR